MSDTRLPVTVLSGFLGARKIIRRLDALPDYPDPFPMWRQAEAAA